MLVICAVTSLTTLKSVLYLGTVGVVFVSDHHHLHRVMMLIAEIMPSSININTVGIFGHLVIGVAIWAPVNTSISLLPRLVTHTEILSKSLHCMFYFGTVEEAPVSANFNLLSGIDLWWIFWKPAFIMMNLVHWVA